MGVALAADRLAPALRTAKRLQLDQINAQKFVEGLGQRSSREHDTPAKNGQTLERAWMGYDVERQTDEARLLFLQIEEHFRRSR